MKQGSVYVVLAALAWTVPATAEPLRFAQYEPHVLPPYAIVPLVRAIGVDPIDQPVRRGPTMYVMHGIDRGDREVRVLIDGRTGMIVAVTPTMATWSRSGAGATTGPDVSLGPGMRMGPYERVPSPNAPTPTYVSPEPPGVYRPGPPAIYDDEPPRVLHGMRPPADMPNASPRVITATPNPQAPAIAAAPLPVIAPTQPGLLPPPPDRFPQRAAPPVTEKPKPVRRAAEVPKQAPLPKPRPAVAGEGGQTGASNVEAAAPPSGPAPQQNRDDMAVAH